MSSGCDGTPLQRVVGLGYPGCGFPGASPCVWVSSNLQYSPSLNRYVLPLWAHTKAASTRPGPRPSRPLMPHSASDRGKPGWDSVSWNTQYWSPTGTTTTYATSFDLFTLCYLFVMLHWTVCERSGREGGWIQTQVAMVKYTH